jgi:cytochrome P450
VACLLQERIFEELESIFGKSDRDVTLDDVNKMDYLKRVIKETLRLFPTIPFIARRVDQDLRTGKHTPANVGKIHFCWLQTQVFILAAAPF